jgi:hypothetical protein
MESENALPCSQERATGRHLETRGAVHTLPPPTPRFSNTNHSLQLKQIWYNRA